MANPLKVLTQLTASKEAQFAEVVEMQKTVTLSGAEADLIVSGGGEISGSGELKIAGVAQLGSSLDVKGASALSGALGVVGAASFQSDISGAAQLNIGGAAHLASTLGVDGVATFASDLSASANARVAGDLSVVGDGNVENFVVRGNLTVQGATTTVESTTLTVQDKNIVLAVPASGPASDAAADGGGITLSGSTDKTFNWVDATDAWTSSEHMNLAAGKKYMIDGSEVLAKNGSAAVMSFEAGAASISVSSTAVSMAGDLDLTNNLHVSGTLGVDGVASFASDITASANMDVAGNINLGAASAYKINNIRTVELLDNSNGEYWTMLKGQGDAKVGIRPDDAFIYGPSGVILDGGAGQVGLSPLVGFSVGPVATFQADITASTNMSLVGDLSLDYNSNVLMGGDRKMFITDAADIAAGIADNPDDLRIQHSSSQYGWSRLNLQYGAGQIEASSGVAIIAPSIYANGVLTAAQDVTASAGLDVAGAAHIAGVVDMDSTLNVDGVASFQSDISGAAGLDMTGVAAFHNDVAMDAALNLSGSEFINITTPVVDGKYNVNDAIRALDLKAGQQASNINNNYAALRFLESKSFDANGMAAFTSSFAAADIEQVTVDVLVQAGGSGPWTNDLVSVQVKAAGSYVGFEVSAPAMNASDKVRLIAVKESGSLA